jgi:hypothetical protein
MPVWRVAPVSDESQLSLVHWRILETRGGARHFVGQDMRDYMGPVSTPVQKFDPALRRGITQSGRVYKLVGPRGCSEDCRYIWTRWCQVNGIISYTDVTTELLAERE